MSARSPPPVGPSPQFAARHPKYHRPTPLSLKKPLPEPPLSQLNLELYGTLPATVYCPEFDEPEDEEKVPSRSSSRRLRSATPTDISTLFDNSETETSSSSSAVTSRAESPVDREGGFVVRRSSGARASEIGRRLRDRDESRGGDRRNSRAGRSNVRNSGRRTPSTPVTPMSPTYPSLFNSHPSTSTPPASSSPKYSRAEPRPEPRPVSPESSSDSPDEEWTPMPTVYSTRPPPTLSRRPSRKMKAVLGIGLAYPPLPASRTSTPSVQTPTTTKHPLTPPATGKFIVPLSPPPPMPPLPKNPIAITPARVKERLKERERKEKLPEKPKETAPKPPARTAPQPKEAPPAKDPILDNWDVSDSDDATAPKPVHRPQPLELKPWQPLSLKKTPTPSIAPSTASSTTSVHTPRAVRPPRTIEHPKPRPAGTLRGPPHRPSTADSIPSHPRPTPSNTPGGNSAMYTGVGGPQHTQSSADIRGSLRGTQPRGRPRRSRIGAVGGKTEESDSSSDSFSAITLPKRSPSAPVATRSLIRAFEGCSDDESDSDNGGVYVLDEHPVVFTTLPEDLSYFNIAPTDFIMNDVFPPKLSINTSTTQPEAAGDGMPLYTIHPAWSAPDVEEVYAAAEKQRKDELAALAAMMDPGSPGPRPRYDSGFTGESSYSPVSASPTSNYSPVTTFNSPHLTISPPTTAGTRPRTAGSPGVSPTTAPSMETEMRRASTMAANANAAIPGTPVLTSPSELSPASVHNSSRWSDYSEAESIKETWRASVLNHFHLPSVSNVRRKLDIKGGVAAAKEGIRKMGVTAETRPGSSTKDGRSSAEELGRRSDETTTTGPLAPGYTLGNRVSTSGSGSGLVSRVGSRIGSGRSDSIVTLGKNMLTRPESRTDRPPMTLGSAGRSGSMGHMKRPEHLNLSSTSTLPTLSALVGTTLPTLSTLSPIPATPKSPTAASPSSDEDYYTAGNAAGGTAGSPGSRRFKDVFGKYMVKDNTRKKEEKRRMELKRKITVIGTGQGSESGYI